MIVLAAVYPQPGHFHGFVGVAQALESAGHEVAFFCPEDLSPRLRQAGLRARCFFPSGLKRQATRMALSSADFAQRLRRPSWARRWYAQALLGPVAEQVEALRSVVRKLEPDILCTDPLLYAGAIVATQERVPWAGIATLLTALSPERFRSGFHDGVAELSAERDALFRSFGVKADFKHGDAVSPWLNTVFATEEFVPRVEGDNVFSTYVGPSSPTGKRGDEPDFPWSRLAPDVPMICVSFGTQTSPPASVFQSLANAFEPREAQLVISLNDGADERWVSSLPDHVIAVRYLPQLALLDRASVMVTHGGVNGVTEALQRGIPMLVIPLAHEQALQAHFVEKRGAGLAMELPEVSTENCRAALMRLLHPDGGLQRSLQALRRSYATDGAAKTAELLTTLEVSK